MPHPKDIQAAEVMGFLTMLVAERYVSSSTHIALQHSCCKRIQA